MYLLMCRSCGEFVLGKKRDGEWVPGPEACPNCDGQSFKDHMTGAVILTDE